MKRLTCNGACGARRGMTLVELVLAMLLASFVMLAVLRLISVTLDLWTKGEARRADIERTTTVAELLAADLRALHGGQAGDLLVEWQPHDADGDHRVDRLWPRIRLVRQASEAELHRLFLAELDPAQRAQLLAEGHLPAEGGDGLALDLPTPTDLVEVAWVIVPAGRDDLALEGLLLRGVQRIGNSEQSYLRERFIDAGGRPPVGALDEVTGGVLWLGLMFATQTTLLDEGWQAGDRLSHAATSWDAWNRGRPDVDASVLNAPAAGMPSASAQPILPRRVRIELEFESERDRARRPRLVDGIERTTTVFEVTRGDLLPRRDESHILVGGEWMELIDVRGDIASVRRGARATLPAAHASGAVVHFGNPVVTEVPVALYSDDWIQR